MSMSSAEHSNFEFTKPTSSAAMGGTDDMGGMGNMGGDGDMGNTDMSGGTCNVSVRRVSLLFALRISQISVTNITMRTSRCSGTGTRLTLASSQTRGRSNPVAGSQPSVSAPPSS